MYDEATQNMDVILNRTVIMASNQDVVRTIKWSTSGWIKQNI